MKHMHKSTKNPSQHLYDMKEGREYHERRMDGRNGLRTGWWTIGDQEVVIQSVNIREQN